MSLPWKILLALAVLLPLGGFVVGSLASAAEDEPPAREPIVLREESTDPSPTGPTRTPGATPRPDDRGSGDGGDVDEGDDDPGDRDDTDDTDDTDDDVPVVSPRPDQDDDGGDGDDGDDDRGGDDDSDDGGDGDD